MLQKLQHIYSSWNKKNKITYELCCPQDEYQTNTTDEATYVLYIMLYIFLKIDIFQEVALKQRWILNNKHWIEYLIEMLVFRRKKK